jgi:hypothetical protein
MRAYLDNNILVYIENGILDFENLKQIIDSRIERIFYSSAHLQEADEIQGTTERERNERIEKRLQTIERITSGNYLYQDLEKNVFLQIEKRRKVLETIREVPFANGAMKALANMITEDQRELSRKSLGLETSRLNNYLPSEVIEHLNKKLTTWGQGHSFMEVLEMGISYHPQGQSFGLSNRIAGVFELLDLLGYWKDKATGKSNYARLWDSNHTFFAAHCDYFISDDKRNRNKARVVYDIYDIGTRVLSSKGEE